MRIGIVAEGPSDCAVLEVLIRATLPGTDIERIRPDMTLESHSPHGWRGVRAWCQENGQQLTLLMTGVIDRKLDAIVVHADCSMLHNVDENEYECPPAQTAADALRLIIARDWLQRHPLPPTVVVVTPAQQTDAWIVAALDPPYANLASIECEDGIDSELVRRRLLRRKEGEVKKNGRAMAPLLQLLEERLDIVYEVCSEAVRFRDDIAAMHQSLTG